MNMEDEARIRNFIEKAERMKHFLGGVLAAVGIAALIYVLFQYVESL